MALVFTPTDNPASINHGFGTGTATYTNANIGTAASDRIVVVNIGGRTGNTSGDTFSSVTIGGNAATLAARATHGNSFLIEQWYLAVPTGTTATVAFTLSGGDVFDRSFCTVGQLTGSASSPANTATKPSGFTGDPNVTTSALTISSGGQGLVALFGDGANATPTYNVGTRDYAVVNSDTLTSGHITATGSQTPSISGFSGNNTAIVASSWDAAGGGGSSRPRTLSMLMVG